MKKLSLKKVTLSSLDKNDMNTIKGGLGTKRCIETNPCMESNPCDSFQTDNCLTINACVSNACTQSQVTCNPQPTDTCPSLADLSCLLGPTTCPSK